MRTLLALPLVLLSGCAALVGHAGPSPAVGETKRSFVFPDECVPPGWKPGDEIVFGWVLPCLDDPVFRNQAEYSAAAGDFELSRKLAHYYAFKADGREPALHWYRRALAIKPSCLSTRSQLAMFLVDRGKNETEVTEGVEIAAAAAVEGDSDSASLLAGHYERKGDWGKALIYKRKLAETGSVSAMIDVSEHLLQNWSASREFLVEACVWLKVAKTRAVSEGWLAQEAGRLEGRLSKYIRANELAKCTVAADQKSVGDKARANKAQKC